MTDSKLFSLSPIKINAYLLNGEDNLSTGVLIQFPIIEYGSQNAKLPYNLLNRIISDGYYSIGNFECGLIPEITKYFHNNMPIAIINKYATKLVELQEKAKELDMTPIDFKNMVIALSKYYDGILGINSDDLCQFELDKNITDKIY